MACPCCHGRVSLSALDCPSCGHPIKPADTVLLERLRAWAIVLGSIGAAALALWYALR